VERGGGNRPTPEMLRLKHAPLTILEMVWRDSRTLVACRSAEPHAFFAGITA